MDMDMRHFLDNRSRPEVRAVLVYGGPSGLVADGVSEDDDDVILMMEAREARDDDDGDIAGVTVETDRNPNSFWR